MRNVCDPGRGSRLTRKAPSALFRRRPLAWPRTVLPGALIVRLQHEAKPVGASRHLPSGRVGTPALFNSARVRARSTWNPPATFCIADSKLRSSAQVHSLLCVCRSVMALSTLLCHRSASRSHCPQPDSEFLEASRVLPSDSST